jgi:hypothetical protein
LAVSSPGDTGRFVPPEQPITTKVVIRVIIKSLIFDSLHEDKYFKVPNKMGTALGTVPIYVLA